MWSSWTVEPSQSPARPLSAMGSVLGSGARRRAKQAGRRAEPVVEQQGSSLGGARRRLGRGLERKPASGNPARLPVAAAGRHGGGEGVGGEWNGEILGSGRGGYRMFSGRGVVGPEW